MYEEHGTHYMQNSVLPIREKEFLFISPDAEHYIVSPTKENGALVRVCNVLIRKEYMDKIIKKYRQINRFADYDFTKMLGNAFCLQLSDDSRIVYNQIMAIAHEYNHFSEGGGDIIENCMINLLIYTLQFRRQSVTGFLSRAGTYVARVSVKKIQKLYGNKPFGFCRRGQNRPRQAASEKQHSLRNRYKLILRIYLARQFSAVF